MTRSRIGTALVAGVLVTMAGAAGIAQEPKATGVVAVRQNTMKSFGGHAGAIQKILTEYPELIDQVPLHAEAIASLSEDVPTMFPQDSMQPASWALPAVWEKPDEFKTAATRTQELAAKVAETAKGGDAKATLAAFAAMGKDGCGGCHNTFRKKE